MSKWKTNLYADGKLLGSVPIRRGIFQGDLFSPSLFVIALLPLTHTLRETGVGYQGVGRERVRIAYSIIKTFLRPKLK